MTTYSNTVNSAKNPPMTKHKDIRHHYETRLTPGRENFDILDWGSRQAQEARFAVLAQVLRTHQLGTRDRPASLLDIGCGLTDLQTYLERQPIFTRYVGVDITPAILQEARRQWPDRELVLADIFHTNPFPPRAFDVAFCSGVMNLNMGNNHDFLPGALARITDAADCCAVVNFLHERTPHKYDHCFYYAVQDVLDAIPNAAGTVDIVDHYLENDFTVVISRGQK